MLVMTTSACAASRSMGLAGEAWMGSGLVLTTRYGTPIDPRNFARFFKARAKKAGVPIISVHATRGNQFKEGVM